MNKHSITVEVDIANTGDIHINHALVNVAEQAIKRYLDDRWINHRFVTGKAMLVKEAK